MVGEPDFAGAGHVQPAEDVQQRRLAAARRPEQHDELAGRDLEVDIVQRAPRPRRCRRSWLSRGRGRWGRWGVHGWADWRSGDSPEGPPWRADRRQARFRTRRRALASCVWGELRQSLRIIPPAPTDRRCPPRRFPPRPPRWEAMRRRTGEINQRHRTILFLVDGRRLLGGAGPCTPGRCRHQPLRGSGAHGCVELPPEEPPAPAPVEAPLESPQPAEITELAVEVGGEAEAPPPALA